MDVMEQLIGSKVEPFLNSWGLTYQDPVTQAFEALRTHDFRCAMNSMEPTPGPYASDALNRRLAAAKAWLADNHIASACKKVAA